jgi:carbon storage regulator
MLVLSRKIGQEVVLADHIRVRVLEIRGNRVRLGFNAPDDVSIQRAELVVEWPAVADRPAATTVDRSQLLTPSV